MAELLKIVRRGPQCPETATVSGGTHDAELRCDLPPDHPGPLHYDDYDQVWWSSDAPVAIRG